MIFPLADVLQFRRESSERHAELTRMSDAELDAHYLRLQERDAWAKCLAAIEASVAAQHAVNEAHKRWFALNSAIARARE